MLRCNLIKEKILILPGFLVGLCCLFIITYRTIIAFSSNSKAITIHINNYGEQYFDIIALIIIWIVCIISLIFLIKIIRKEKEPIFLNTNSDIKLNRNKAGFLAYFSKSNRYNKK